MTNSPRALILRAPGINCERETLHAFELAGAAPEFVHVNALCEKPSMLADFGLFVVPGGFAYGDDIAAGRVLANRIKNRAGDELLQFVERGGLALGICNGFQTLVRLGLLPRTARGPLVQEVSLAHNLSDHYECRWVTLRSPENRCLFLDAGVTIHVPAAHGEGYLQARDEQAAQTLKDEGFVAFEYLDANGQSTEAYPANPNGSPLGIAGLTDSTGQVLGLMPHPDRAYLPFHDPHWRREGLAERADGMRVFDAMVRAAKA